MIRRRALLQGLSVAAAGSLLPLTQIGQSSAASSATELGKVLGPSSVPRCDDYAVGGGVVRWSDEHQKWLMWYYCRDQQFAKDVAPTLGSGRIALAMSNDGKSWDRYDGPGFGGSIMGPSNDPDDFDSTHIAVLDVTRVGGRWYLWYLGGDHTQIELSSGLGPRGYRMRSGLAVSEDGLSFERVRGSAPGGAALDFLGYTFTTWPNGVHDGEKFVMYYTTVDASVMQFGTEVAESKDGVNWETRGPILWNQPPTSYEEKGIMTRHVLRNPDSSGKKWLMLYTALDGSPAQQRSIFAAESEDGLRWDRLFDTPIFEVGAADAWDGGGVAIPQLVQVGQELRLYYFGFPRPDNEAAPNKGIGLAVSRSGSLRDFKRVVASK